MEFLQLKYFQHSAGSGSFSHTAEVFQVPPSSVSVSIKRLEQELGVNLFDRTSNRIALNENGKLFLQFVNNMFRNLEAVTESLKVKDDRLQGRIHMLIRTNRQIVTKCISQFRRNNPEVSFQLDFDGNCSYSEYDVIVTDEVIKNPAFEAHEFLREEIRLAVHQDNPLARAESLDMHTLADAKFICLPAGHSLRTITDRLCKEACIRPDLVIECSDTYYIRQYLDMNMGVSLVPTISWKEQLADSLSLVQINGGVYRDTAVYVNRNASSAAAARFAETLLEVKKQEP